MTLFYCKICNHVEFNAAPESCPVCHAPKKQFEPKDSLFEEAMAASKEGAVKHIPAVTVNKTCGLIPEQSCKDVVVRIGETLHPMEAAHYITFIDCYVEHRFVSRVSLSPDVYAAASFHLKTDGAKVTVVEHCNKHGHWMAEAPL